MNATQTLGSSRALGSALDAPTRLYSRSYPRRYSIPCVGSAAAVSLPTVREDQESSFSYDKVKAFTSGALLGSPFAHVLPAARQLASHVSDGARSIRLDFVARMGLGVLLILFRANRAP